MINPLPDAKEAPPAEENRERIAILPKHDEEARRSNAQNDLVPSSDREIFQYVSHLPTLAGRAFEASCYYFERAKATDAARVNAPRPNVPS